MLAGGKLIFTWVHFGLSFLFWRFDSHDDNEDEYSQTIEEVILEGETRSTSTCSRTMKMWCEKTFTQFTGPASLEQKLKSMQQQLLDMTDIPPQIRAKVTMISKALERFMTMDAETFEEQPEEVKSVERALSESKEVTTEDDDADDDDAAAIDEEEKRLVMHEEISSSAVNEKPFSSIPEEDEHDIEAYENDNCQQHRQFSLTRESFSSSCSYDDDEEATNEDNRRDVKRIDQSGNTEVDIDDVDEVATSTAGEDESSDEEITREPSEEVELVVMDEEKRKKHEKIQKLEQHWQKLCSNTKTIHK